MPQSNPIGKPAEMYHPSMSFNHAELEAIAMSKRPELHGIQARIEEQETMARLAKRNYYPDFTVTFMIQNVPSIGRNAWGLDFGFNIPLWINLKQKQEVEEAEAHALANRSELYALRAKIRGRIQELLAKLQSAEERIILYKTGLVPKTAEALSSNEYQYRIGQGDFLTLLDTRRQLHDVALDYERTRIEREILLAELERAIGAPFTEVSRAQQLRKPKIKSEEYNKGAFIQAKPLRKKRNKRHTTTKRQAAKRKRRTVCLTKS